MTHRGHHAGRHGHAVDQRVNGQAEEQPEPAEAMPGGVRPLRGVRAVVVGVLVLVRDATTQLRRSLAH